jgi:hypothetical protein
MKRNRSAALHGRKTNGRACAMRHFARLREPALAKAGYFDARPYDKITIGLF